MNRQIKFRGHRLNTNEWVFGSLIQETNRHGSKFSILVLANDNDIEDETHQVYYPTVGQYTGLKDKAGNEGYENDILQGSGKLWQINWQQEEARFIIMPFGHSGNWLFMDEIDRMVIVGNIYENNTLTP